MSAPDRERSRALDGLRGVAVLAVVLFHLGLSAFPGGLLGVDVFFVLSGFLITGLLLDEWRSTGRISLRRFWVRRWRRLLPALLLTLVVVSVLAQWMADPAEVDGIRDEAVATLAYVSNWQAVAAGQSYFDVVAPSPLRHTWSLGVEEQFYVVWPLLAVVALAVRRSSRLLLGLALGGAGVSLALLVGLEAAGSSLDRLYYGTDTRVFALLLGSAAATVLHRRAFRRVPVARSVVPVGARTARQLAVGGWIGAAVLLVFVLRVDGTAGWLYRGGFGLVAVAAVTVVVAVVLVPRGALARGLGVAPLAYLGRISYGVYLAHWPVVVFLTPDRVPLGEAGLAVLRAAVTLAVAALSFALIEQPIRRHGLRLPSVRHTPARLPRVAVPAAVAGLAAVLLVAPLPTASPDTSLTAFSAGVPAPPPVAPSDEPVASPTSQRVLAPAVTRRGPLRVMLVGDSVAWSLGQGMLDQVDPATTVFSNQGYLGCGIARGEPRGYFQPPACLTWPQRWQGLVDTFRPDVTLFLPSVWDTFDRQRDSRWQRIGEPEFDAYLRGEFELAMRTLTSRGGRVAVLSPPCNEVQLANGVGKDRLPADVADRLQRLTALLQPALDRYPGRVAPVPLDQLLCPKGEFERRRDGRPLRQPDGIHIEPYGGELFVREQLPQVLRWVRTPVTAES